MGAVVDRGFVLDALVPGLDMAGALTLKVGVMAGATNIETGRSVAEYAAYNEYGTQKIPARPFLRQTLDKNRERYLRGLSTELASGMEPEMALRRLGEVMEGDIKAAIEGWTTPPNSPETVARKGGRDTPLRDTGSMLKSITHRVDAGGGA